MTQQRYPLNELSVAVAPARERHRELIDAAVAWLSAGVDPDHLALICAGADDSSTLDGVTPTRWTRTGVYHVVRCDIPNWCSSERTLWPVTICETLWGWFDFLHGSGRLDPSSDPVAELRKPLTCYGWLDQDGRPMASDARRQVECECFLPYRETVELLNEIGRRGEYSGEEAVDVLRRVAGRAPVPRWSPQGGDGAALWDDDPWTPAPAGFDPACFDPDGFDPDGFDPDGFDPAALLEDPPGWAGDERGRPAPGA